jgi:hypothetical protein
MAIWASRLWATSGRLVLFRPAALWVSPGAPFLASAYRELNVGALVCSQGFVYRASANLLAKASGRPVLEGSDVPFLD